MLDEKLISRVPPDGVLKNWKDVQNAFRENCAASKQWIFRGQENENWTFRTRLERTVLTQSRMRDARPVTPADQATLEREVLQKGLEARFDGSDPFVSISALEGGLLRRFMRQCHHYLTDTPSPDEVLEWFALMQHHGAPTRLHDWTWSFLVALFFAVQNAPGAAAVWAIDSEQLRESIPKDLQEVSKPDPMRKLDNFRSVLQRKHSCIFKVSPFRLNQRLVIQQGAFLAPGNVGKSFDDNLTAALKVSKVTILKFVIDGSYETRREILYELHRSNVNAATLFPDLDGFARSLEQLLAFPDVIPPEADWGK